MEMAMDILDKEEEGEGEEMYMPGGLCKHQLTCYQHIHLQKTDRYLERRASTASNVWRLCCMWL